MPTISIRAKIPSITFLKRSAYMPSEGGLSSLCSTSPPFAAKACCKTDQRPPAVELTFWLPLCGSSAKGNTAFRMEELQLCGPTVPTPLLPRCWLACGVGWGPSTRRLSPYLARHGLWNSIIPFAFIWWLFFALLPNLIPRQLCVIAYEMNDEISAVELITDTMLAQLTRTSLCKVSQLLTLAWEASFWHLEYSVRRFKGPACLSRL